MRTLLTRIDLTITTMATFMLLSCSETNKPENWMNLFKDTKINMEGLVEQLSGDLNSTESMMSINGDSLTVLTEYQRLYEENLYKPFWLNEDGLNAMATGFLMAADSLKYDAIQLDSLYLNDLKIAGQIADSAHLSVSSAEKVELLFTKAFFAISKALVLSSQREKNKNWKIQDDTLFSPAIVMQEAMRSHNMYDALNTLRPQHPWYLKFRDEYIKVYDTEPIVQILELDEIRDTVATGKTSSQIIPLRKKLFSEISLPKDTISGIWDSALNLALVKYQSAHQLKKTGWVDTATYHQLRTVPLSKQRKLALNMERMRKMNREFKQPFIWVVVPRMELDYYDRDTVRYNMRVVVGRTTRPTPSLKSKVENIVLSPPWTVPPTIMKEEVIPGITRRGSSYLTRRGLRAFDRHGRRVNPVIINASNFGRFSIGQSPGYRSSLGEVKFNMINPWAIYMHDTPHRNDFVKSYRAFSSGCIRVHHPKEFAAFLLQDTVKYSYSKIDSLCKKRRTIYIPMKRDIDVHVVYLTTAVDSIGNVIYLKDIYKWDTK